MANDIEIRVSGVNDFAKTSAAINRSLSKIKKNAEQANQSLSAAWAATAISAERASTSTSRLGDQLDTVTTKSQRVGESASNGFDKMGESARKSKKDTDGLGEGLGKTAGIGEQLKKAFTDLADEGPKAIGLAMKALTSGGPYVAAAGAGIGLVLSSAIGAAISGAMLGGLGAGAIALGIKGAASSPQVAAAVEDLKNDLGQQLSMIGVPFQKPVTEAITSLGKALESLDLTGAFAPLAGVIGPVTDDLIIMARNAMPGLEEALAAAAPFIEQVASTLPDVGMAIGDFAQSMADAGPGAAKFFQVFIQFAGAFLMTAGDTIERLSKIYDVVGRFGEAIGMYDFDVKKFETFRGVISDTDSSMSDLASSAARAAAGVVFLQDSMMQLLGAAMTADEATIRYRQSIADLNDTIRENGVTFDDNTAKGRENHLALLDVAQGALDLYEANRNAGMGSDQATAAYNAQILALENQMHAMGMTQAQVDALIGKYREIPPAVPTNVAVQGAPAAVAAADAVRNALAAIGDRRVTVSVVTAGVAAAQAAVAAAVAAGAAGHRARGGPVQAQRAYVVGDGGRPELFVPDQNGTVLPSIPGGGGGGSVINNYVTIHALDPMAAADAVGEALVRYTKISGPLPARMVAPV